MSKYLFFDLETNDKIKDWSAKPEDFDLYPRITQLAFQEYGENEQLISEYSALIYPDGWTIPETQFFIENNMSTQRCIDGGVAIDGVLQRIIDARLNAEYVINHNINFDAKILRAEMIRAKREVNFTAKKICTMHSSRKFCALPKSKIPSLKELYVILFNEEFPAHDALEDVKATAKCFFELKRRGVIQL